MDFYTLLAHGLEETIKCFVCQNYLSFFPLHVCSNNLSICGRCATPEELVSYENNALEAVAQFMRFPCRYQSEGCPQELLPKEVPQHEETCQFRKVECIVANPEKCPWLGSLPTLLQHCKIDHSELILSDNIDIDLLSNKEFDRLVERDDNLYIFTSKFEPEDQVLQFVVRNSPYDSSTRSTECQLRIRAKKTLLFNFDTNTGLNNLCLKYIISEGDTTANVELFLGRTEVKQGNKNTNAELLEILKCSECSNFITPPVLQCMDEVILLCSDCEYDHSRSCAICSEDRCKKNPFLEKMADLVVYPCKGYKYGCKFKAKLVEMKTHELDCIYRTEKCPLCLFKMCQWRGFEKDITEHILKNHVNILFETSETSEILSDEKNAKCRIVQSCGKLFLLVFWRRESKFSWIVSTIGQSKERFIYEVHVLDATRRGQRLVFRKFCCDDFTQMITDCLDVDKIVDNSFYIDHKLLESFANNRNRHLEPVIRFSVKIFRC